MMTRTFIKKGGHSEKRSDGSLAKNKLIFPLALLSLKHLVFQFRITKDQRHGAHANLIDADDRLEIFHREIVGPRMQEFGF